MTVNSLALLLPVEAVFGAVFEAVCFDNVQGIQLAGTVKNWLAAITAVTAVTEQACFALLKGREAVTSSAQRAKIVYVVEIVAQPMRVFSERNYVVHLRVKRLQRLLAHGASMVVLL